MKRWERPLELSSLPNLLPIIFWYSFFSPSLEYLLFLGMYATHTLYIFETNTKIWFDGIGSFTQLYISERTYYLLLKKKMCLPMKFTLDWICFKHFGLLRSNNVPLYMLYVYNITLWHINSIETLCERMYDEWTQRGNKARAKFGKCINFNSIGSNSISISFSSSILWASVFKIENFQGVVFLNQWKEQKCQIGKIFNFFSYSFWRPNIFVQAQCSFHSIPFHLVHVKCV